MIRQKRQAPGAPRSFTRDDAKAGINESGILNRVTGSEQSRFAVHHIVVEI